MALSDTGSTSHPYPQEYQVSEYSLTVAQSTLRQYLWEVLRWYYQRENWFITGNIALRHPLLADLPDEVDPSLSVYIGTVITRKELARLDDWDIEARGAPTVVFEISSPFDWQNDIQNGPNQKPILYGRIGVKEYWAYDPNDPKVWLNVEGRRLMGWRYDSLGQSHVIEPNERGWYWSVELDSWLSENDDLIALYDASGQSRPTSAEVAEFEQEARQAAEAAKAAERQARLIAEQKAQEAFQLVQAERQARQRAEAERQAAEAREKTAAAEAQLPREVAERQAQELAELQRELRRLKGERAE